MINVLINGRIKNKQKVLEYSHNILKHLMPRIRREVDVIIDIVKNIDDTDWLVAIFDCIIILLFCIIMCFLDMALLKLYLSRCFHA